MVRDARRDRQEQAEAEPAEDKSPPGKDGTAPAWRKSELPRTYNFTDLPIGILAVILFLFVFLGSDFWHILANLRQRWESTKAERLVRAEKEAEKRRLKEEQAEIETINHRLRAHDLHQPGERKTIPLANGVTMEMVWCPPGAFMMGSPETEAGHAGDEKQHRVTLTKGFWLAKHEVTQEQWKSVMGSNPSLLKGDALPVENVSWEDCQAFCGKTGLRLPTEAQWEYACRSGTTGPFSGTGKLEEMGWYAKNSGQHPQPVGKKPPNAWGLYDMHGNVREWCGDWYMGDYGAGAVTNPPGPATGNYHVLRGGSYRSSAQANCRSANRVRKPGVGDSGFRPLSQ